MADDQHNDAEARRTHLMEVPSGLVQRHGADGGDDDSSGRGSPEDDEDVDGPPPSSEEATMALDISSVDIEARRSDLDSRADIEPDDQQTRLIDVRELRRQHDGPSKPKPHNACGPSKPESRPPRSRSGPRLLEPSRAVKFPLGRLERMTRKECDSLDALYAVFSPPSTMSELTDAVGRRLEELMGCAHRVQWRGAAMAVASGRSMELGEGVWSWGRMPPEHDRFAVGVQRRLANRWLEVIGVDKPGLVGGDFEFGQITFVLAEFCAVFGKKLQWSPWSWGVNPLSNSDLKTMLLSQSSMLLEVTFAVDCGGRGGLVRWWLPLQLVRRLQVAAEKRPNWNERARTAWWGGLTVRRPVVAGFTSVPKAVWRQLRIGDVLAIDHHGVDEGEVAETARPRHCQCDIGGGWALRGRLVAAANGNWEFEIDSCQPKANRERNMSSENQADEEADHSGTVPVEKTEMEVEVRLGTVEMELADLARVQPGQVLDCDAPLSSSVELVVSGVSVGKGELVGVDGRLGVRILSMEAR